MQRFVLCALFMILGVLWAPCVSAQTDWVYATGATASVDGVVVDAASGERLPGANIALGNGKSGTSSGPSGNFKLHELQPGTYTLICTFVGYEKKSLTLDLKPGDQHQLNIELQPEEFMMQEMVVKSEVNQERIDIGMARINSEMINRLPSAFEADLFRSLQHLPGVKSSSDFSSGLHIRGGSPDQTLILLDDAPVYNPSHFFGFYSTFNPDAIDGIQLYKGNYPARYGGRLGSVLEIKNKNGNRDEMGGRLTVGMLASRLALDGPYSKGNWMLSVRRSTLEPMLAVLRDQVDQIPEAFSFYDINGKINFDHSPEDKFSLSFYYGKDQVNFPLATEANLELDYGNQIASGKWTHLFNNAIFTTTNFSYSGYYNKPVNTIAGTRQGIHNYIRDYSVSQKLYFIPGSAHQFETGVNAGILELGFSNRLNNENTFALNTSSVYGSWYLQHQWEAGEHWTFTTGLRLNGFSKSNYLKLNPRISVNYSPALRIQFELGYGRYDQFLSQTANQGSGFNLWLSSGEKIQPSAGSQFLVGMKSTPFNNIGFYAEAYYRTMEDMFELDPFLPDMAGLGYHELFRIGQGHAYGVELMLKKRAGKLNGYIGYNWSISNRKFPNINHGQFYPSSYNREHEFNVVLNYKFSANWKATATFNYATGQPYTEPAGHQKRGGSIPGYKNTVVFIVNEINGARLPAYHRMDLGITKYGRFLGTADSKLSFQLVNAYSRRNAWHLQHNVYRGKISSTTAFMLPVLPALTYTINF